MSDEKEQTENANPDSGNNINNVQETGRERSNKNLIPAKPGDVKNPNGRPKGSLNRKTIFKRLLECAALDAIHKMQTEAMGGIPEEMKPQTVADQLAMQLIIAAMTGDRDAINDVFDNACDKLTETKKIEGNMTLANVLASVKESGPDALPKLSQPKPQEPQCQTPKIPLPKLKPSKPQS